MKDIVRFTCGCLDAHRRSYGVTCTVRLERRTMFSSRLKYSKAALQSLNDSLTG
jgi:hypothetical protein